MSGFGGTGTIAGGALPVVSSIVAVFLSAESITRRPVAIHPGDIPVYRPPALLLRRVSVPATRNGVGLLGGGVTFSSVGIEHLGVTIPLVAQGVPLIRDVIERSCGQRPTR